MCEEIKARLKELQAEEVHNVLGAWISGMGLVLLLIGLNVWIKATCEEHCCKHHNLEGEK